MKAIKPILFLDFDGTICHDRYWRSLPKKYHRKVQDLLFGHDRTLVNEWMRGKYTAEEINRFVAEKIGLPFDILWELFVKDCNTMRISQETLERISALRAKYKVILMTGNMDSFSRFTVPALSLERYFDDISNSYYEGRHKVDNAGEIFIEHSKTNGVPLRLCIVIDDSQNVCRTFESLGGTAYFVTPKKDVNHYLSLLLDNI